MVITNDEANATKILKSTSKMKQNCHEMFMKYAFTSQTRGDFCGLASIASSLHYLNKLIKLKYDSNTHNIDNVKNQKYIYNNYVKGCLDIKYGISMQQLIQIISSIISDYNLPYLVSHVCMSNLEKLSKTFKYDIKFINELFDQKNGENQEKKEEKKEEKENNKNNNDNNNGPPFICIANYYRKIDNHRGGHWSPIINISADLQWIFIADVSSHRIKPHWIKINDFVPLMCRRVNSTNLPRGYIRIYHDNLAADNLMNDRLIINKENNIYIRIATSFDALTLSKIQVAAWKQTYRGIIDDQWLDSKSMTVERKYGYWMQIFNDNYLISNNQTPSKKNSIYKYVMVICKNNQIYGYCTVGQTGIFAKRKTLPLIRNYDKNIRINGELYTIYLSPNCPRRQGFGGNLFDVGYDLIRYQFDWNKMIQSRNQHKNNKINNDEKCVMVLWCLGDNKVAMNFYKKKGGIMVNDHEKAHFGAKTYRYSSVVFGL